MSIKNIETDALVIGGGATGTGIARDLALRGIKTLLVEKDDLAAGTTGRNHGLLHSGARYAVKDIESATECITENRILKRIAGHCIEDTGGLFVSLKEDDPSYISRLLDGCRLAGIKTKQISVKKALQVEPGLNPEIMSAICVPDGLIDPFRLAAANMLDAEENGASLLTHTRVTKINTRQNEIEYLECRGWNRVYHIYPGVVINAAGIWGEGICGLAGIELKMLPSKGSLLIIDYRINNLVVNRCRMPSDGDIVVPGDTVSIIGTTSKKISYKKIDDLTVDAKEIEILLNDGSRLIPGIKKARALRAYAGVRPLLDVSGIGTGREISRGISVIDHSARDGLNGFITVAGGKLMTYRLMAEMAADLACRKLGVRKKCVTHRIPLPGSESVPGKRNKMKKLRGLPASVAGSTLYRHGQRAFDVLKKEKRNRRIICECEMVTEGEILYALNKLNARTIIDLRRRTRIGMGPCQGELCAYRSAGLLSSTEASERDPLELLEEFLEERWKGQKPVLWGDGLREAEFTYWIYRGLMGLGEDDDNAG
jgi:glycerol-3-phosphate dehydrogenase